MPKPLTLEVNAYSTGLVTGRSARLIPPDAATLSQNCNYARGSLSGLYAPGDAVTTLTIGTRFAHLRDGVGWRAVTYKNFACFDTPRAMGGTLTGVSYYTNVDGSGANQPLVSAGAGFTDKVLGLAVPTITSTSNGGSGTSRAYRITRQVLVDNLGASWESNPSNTVTLTQDNGAVLNFAAAGTNSTGVTYYTNIYATQAGTTSGPFYWIGFVAGSATSFTDLNYAFGVPTILLNWDAGGSPQGALYKYDHGTSPSLYVLANALLGVPAVPAAAVGIAAAYSHVRAGILFGANYATLYWSANGTPWYWPQLNAEELDDIIEAIVVDRTTAYVFTRSSIYTITGSDDTALSINKTPATHGCYPQGGPAVKQTPHGIFYPTQQGIAVFDGNTSRLVTEGLLEPGLLPASTTQVSGAFQDELYIVAGDSTALALYLGEWPKISITQIDAAAHYKAMTVVRPYASAGYDANALYIYENVNDYIKPWSPRQGGHNATQYTFTHQTGALDAGEPNKKKRFIRFWPSFVGSITYTISCVNFDGTVVGTATLTGAGWLPATFTGDYLLVSLTAGSASSVHLGMRVEAEVYV